MINEKSQAIAFNLFADKKPNLHRLREQLLEKELGCDVDIGTDKFVLQAYGSFENFDKAIKIAIDQKLEKFIKSEVDAEKEFLARMSDEMQKLGVNGAPLETIQNRFDDLDEVWFEEQDEFISYAKQFLKSNLSNI